VEATAKIDSSASGRIETSSHISLVFCCHDEVRAYALREGGSWTVGRSEPAEIVLQHRALSALHARFSLREGRVLIEDLHSTNGCFVNGEKVTSATITEGDVVEVGGVDVRVAGRAAASESRHVVSHAAYLALMADEVTRASLYARKVAAVAVRHADDAAIRDTLHMAVQALDKICSFAPTLSLLLLPEQDEISTQAWCDRVFKLAPGGLQIGVAVSPTVAGNAQELVGLALDACHGAVPGAVKYAGKAPTAAPITAIIVNSPCTQRLYDLVSRAAGTTLPVLVRGETGSGKEIVARAIHDLGPRSGAPFKTLNCGAIPTQLVESVLFGHERGAFTGADRQTCGVFEQAQGGTVFLDEIGELPLAAQIALLRVLELRKVVRLGGSKEIDLDVRVVAATHRNLEHMARAKAFREDLLFRLDALTLHVPPLRARKEEILPLAELFLSRARSQWKASAQRLSDEAKEALQTYPFPGNVRQLKNAIERAAVVCTGDEVQLEDLPPQLWSDALDEANPFAAPTGPLNGAHGSLTQRVRAFEVELIRQALSKTHGNQSEAARLLGVARRTLASKVHALGLLDEG
jgi:DNA-binding NtrC family response regulator